MSRFAILTMDNDPGLGRPMAVTISGKEIVQAPYEKLSTQIWMPRFCMGVKTAGVAFINTAGPSVALRGKELRVGLEAAPFHGDDTDDQILWSFEPGTKDFSLRIIWAHDMKGALNAAGAVKDGNAVCVYNSGTPSPTNENWRLLMVEG